MHMDNITIKACLNAGRGRRYDPQGNPRVPWTPEEVGRKSSVTILV